MKIKEEEFNSILANNLIKYRKANNLTQVDLARLLNYSDKAISKWERAESFPDIYTLYKIAEIYKITVNDLFSKSMVKKSKALIHTRTLIMLLSMGLAFLVAAVCFAFLHILQVEKSWIPFVIAIVCSGIIGVVFSSIWHYRIIQSVSASVIIWSTVLTCDLCLPIIEKYVLYIVAVPLQILVLLYIYLKVIVKKFNKDTTQTE